MKVERFLHWSLLLFWFLLRYVLDCILQLADPLVAHNSNNKLRMKVPNAWDKDWLHFSSQLISLLVAWQNALKVTAKLVRAVPWLLVPLLLVAEHLWISSTSRILTGNIRPSSLIWNCCQRLIYWYIPTKALASIISPSIEDKLWKFLSNVIAFTTHTTTTTMSKSFANSSGCNMVWISSLIKTAILSLMLATVVTCRGKDRSWYHSQYHHYPDEVPYSGFSAKIPSCYDGDTCHLQDLAYNGQLLPPLFQQMNVRIKGIDAPERSRSRCPLEHCLAELSLKAVEDILGVGNGEILQLINCQHDKYGKRLLCSILTSSSLDFDNDVASQLLATSPALAVPYYGKTKTSPWCTQTFQHQYQDDPYLQRCHDIIIDELNFY